MATRRVLSVRWWRPATSRYTSQEVVFRFEVELDGDGFLIVDMPDLDVYIRERTAWDVKRAMVEELEGLFHTYCAGPRSRVEDTQIRDQMWSIMGLRPGR